MYKIFTNKKAIAIDDLLPRLFTIIVCVLLVLVLNVSGSNKKKAEEINIQKKIDEIGYKQILLDVLEQDVGAKGKTMKLSQLVSIGEESYELQQEIRFWIDLLLQDYPDRTIRTTYPSGEKIELYKSGNVLARTEIPSIDTRQIIIELTYSLKSQEAKMQALTAGDEFPQYGQTWVAWGVGKGYEYFKLKDCYCETKLVNGITECQDGKQVDPTYFIYKDAFSPETAARVIKSCNELRNIEAPANNLMEISKKISTIVQDNQLGASITDTKQRTWVYWGSYNYPLGSNPIDPYQFWTSTSICVCKPSTNCPNTCKTEETMYYYLKCEEDKDELYPESVKYNQIACFKTTKWVKENI